MAHLFTYNPLSGLSAGVPITVGAPLSTNPSRVAPPHLSVGVAGFIDVNTRWRNAHIVSGRLLRSSITMIEPQGKRVFYVFDAPRANDNFNSIVFIDTSMPKNMKRRAETDVNAWTGMRGEGFKTICFDSASGGALLHCGPNATIELFQFDGSVHLLSVVNGKVSTVPLSQKQMAKLRVDQFEEQIAILDLSAERDVRRLHGIIAGALRLVSVVKEAAALDVLGDFFITHQAELTDNLRMQVRGTLTDRGHSATGTFLDGFEATNVVKIRSLEAVQKRAQAEQKRRERSIRDRELRASMRGGNGGQNNKQSAGKKKRA
jgi:hypothetical protein